jgi:hypothetical protein
MVCAAARHHRAAAEERHSAQAGGRVLTGKRPEYFAARPRLADGAVRIIAPSTACKAACRNAVLLVGDQLMAVQAGEKLSRGLRSKGALKIARDVEHDLHRALQRVSTHPLVNVRYFIERDLKALLARIRRLTRNAKPPLKRSAALQRAAEQMAANLLQDYSNGQARRARVSELARELLCLSASCEKLMSVSTPEK